MISRFARVLFLLIWVELGLVLVLVPWSDVWEANYFLVRYPVIDLMARSPYLRGAISGLGVMNIFLALESFRRRMAPVIAKRT
jgi:hypothetical protein